MIVDLEVLDYAGPTRWRWRLTTTSGVLLADHQVSLDAGAMEYFALGDLAGYVDQYVALDNRPAGEQRAVDEIGRWLGEHVFGPVGAAIVAHRPVTVRLHLDQRCADIAALPLEAAYVTGKPLAFHGVAIVIQFAEESRRLKAPAGDSLRILAVFSVPTDTHALNLRRERHALTRLIREFQAVGGRSIELRVVQYGVTVDRLRDVLLDYPGWDVVHISGHGTAAEILLENPDGTQREVTGNELIDMLEPAAERVKLVILSSCGSATMPAHFSAGNSERNGIPAGDDFEADPEPSQRGPSSVVASLAVDLTSRIGCAVLGMRYEVYDEFAIRLIRQLYKLMFSHEQPLARALPLAVKEVMPTKPSYVIPPLSLAVPALFGATAAGLELRPPQRQMPVQFDLEELKLADFPEEPDRFVGRVRPMAEANEALAPASGLGGVIFYGPPGIGKRSCALELAYAHATDFSCLIWHDPLEMDSELDIAESFGRLFRALERKIPGLSIAHLAADLDALQENVAFLRKLFRDRRILVVIDNLEALLTYDGTWRDERWRVLLTSLCGAGMSSWMSRVVLATSRMPADALLGLRVERIEPLSVQESLLLAWDLPNLRQLIVGEFSQITAGSDVVGRLIAQARGHPMLLEIGERHAGSTKSLGAFIDSSPMRNEEPGEQCTTTRDYSAGVAPADFVRVLLRWTQATTAALQPACAEFFYFLCCIEPADRTSEIVAPMRQAISPDAQAELDAIISELAAHGLVTGSDLAGAGYYELDAAIATAGRQAASSQLRARAISELSAYWQGQLLSARGAEPGASTWSVVAAARRALPYATRQEQWGLVGELLDIVLRRDRSRATAESLLQHATRMVAATRDTEHALSDQARLALIKSLVSPEVGQELLAAALRAALSVRDYRVASEVLGGLADAVRFSGNLAGALKLAERKKLMSRAGDLAQWTQLADDLLILQISFSLGKGIDETLREAQLLRDRMKQLTDDPDTSDITVPWDVRERLLGFAARVAGDRFRFGEALSLNAALVGSMRQRRASPLAIASTRFDDYFALARLHRVREARDLVLNCREVFEREGDYAMLAWAMHALADLEEEEGRPRQAIRLAEDTLRIMYREAAGGAIGPLDIARGHNNLAIYLRSVYGVGDVSLAHLVASALIQYQTESSDLRRPVLAIARDLADAGLDITALPTFDEVCGIADRVAGVRYRDAFVMLPSRVADGAQAVAALAELVRGVSPEELFITKQAFGALARMLGILVTIGAGSARGQAVAEALAKRGQLAQWRPLLSRLSEFWSMREDDDPLADLSPVDGAVVAAYRDLINGAWLPASDDPEPWWEALEPAIEEMAKDFPLIGRVREQAELFGDPESGQEWLDSIATVVGSSIQDVDDVDFRAVAIMLRKATRMPALVTELARSEDVRAVIIGGLQNAFLAIIRSIFSASFEPYLAALAAAAAGDVAARDALADALEELAANDTWRGLATAIRAVLEGERDLTAFQQLDLVDTALIQRAIDVADGRMLAQAAAGELVRMRRRRDIQNMLTRWEGLISRAADAAEGNPAARSALEATLNSLRHSPEWADVADALERVIDGEREAEDLAAGLNLAGRAIIERLLSLL